MCHCQNKLQNRHSQPIGIWRISRAGRLTYRLRRRLFFRDCQDSATSETAFFQRFVRTVLLRRRLFIRDLSGGHQIWHSAHHWNGLDETNPAHHCREVVNRPARPPKLEKKLHVPQHMITGGRTGGADIPTWEPALFGTSVRTVLLRKRLFFRDLSGGHQIWHSAHHWNGLDETNPAHHCRHTDLGTGLI